MVNEILINYYKTDSTLSAADSSTLFAIAYENALTGGPGVYQARAFLQLDVEDLMNGETRREEIVGEMDNTIQVFPNPNNGSFTIKGKSLEKCQLLVLDMEGKRVHGQSVIFNEQAQSDLNLSLPVGVYIIQLINGDRVVDTSFLNIVSQ